MKPVPQTFCCTLTYYTVRRYSVNLLRSQSGMVRTEQRIRHQRTITVSHNHSPSSSSSDASSETVRRYSVNLLRSQSGMVRTEQRIRHQRTITVSHNHSPSSSSSDASSETPSLLSCSCSSTSFIFCGIGSPRCPAFSSKLTPSLEI